MSRAGGTLNFFLAEQIILNRLCVIYRMSSDRGYVSADELRQDLKMPEHIFMEALNSLSKKPEQMAVEVSISDNTFRLRLSDVMKDLCSGWLIAKERATFPDKLQTKDVVDEGRERTGQLPISRRAGKL